MLINNFIRNSYLLYKLVNNNQLKTNIFKLSDFVKLVQSKLNHTKRFIVIYIFNSHNDLL